jgi:hypothetical protein
MTLLQILRMQAAHPYPRQNATLTVLGNKTCKTTQCSLLRWYCSCTLSWRHCTHPRGLLHGRYDVPIVAGGQKYPAGHGAPRGEYTVLEAQTVPAAHSIMH